MHKLKGFISYAHDDAPYFNLIKEGFSKHGKHSKLIDSNLWHDGEIPVGALWHEAIQKQVQGCDFAVFLVSASFLSSDYIEEHEFKNFLKRQEEEANFLFFPILISPCNFKYWEELAARQFFKPDGLEYGFPYLGSKFTFSHLTQLSVRTGEPTPINEGYYQQYFVDLLEKIEEALQEYHEKKEARKAIPTSKYFRILPIAEIKPIDFLETRSFPQQGFRPYYLNRPYIDKLLLYNYQNKRHTIITGKPLAGKTRSIYELCEEQLKNEDILILFPERIDIQIQDFKIPETDKDIIIFFDDFDQFLQLLNLEIAISKALLHPKVWIVATCRKDKLDLVESRLIDDFHNFEIHEILYLNDEEKKQLDIEIPDKPNQKSDGTIGGYFLPLNIMRGRYKSLQKDSLEREIFHACKALRVWGRMESDSSFQKEQIKKYCQKRFEKYYQLNQIISPFEWDKAFQNLNQKDLIFEEEAYVLVEELYLDFLPATEEKLEKEILNYFPSLILYNKFLYKTRNFQEAQGVLAQMKKEGVRPDEFTFSSLLNKAPDFQEAQGVLAQMKKEGVRPDEFTFSSLLNKAPNFQEAQEVLAQMKKEGVRPNEVTFSSLLNKAPDFQEAQGVLAQMKKEGVRPNEFTFNSLLNKVPDFQEAQGVLAQMKKEGVRPDEVTFSSLLNKASDFQEAQWVLAQMKKEGVRPDEVTFSSLLNKAPDFQEAQGVLAQMKKEGVRPNEFTFNSLLNKVPDFQEAQGVLAQMKKEGVRPDEVTFSSLLNKAPDFQEAQGVWAQMKKEGVRPNEFTFNSLLNKVPDFQEAQWVLAQMKKEGVRPNEVTFNSLLNKASDFQEAQGVLAQMKKEGVRPDEFTFSSLLNKAPDFQEAQWVSAQMKKEGVRPDEFTFNSLLNKAPDFQEAQGVLAQMKKEGVRPDEVTFNSLLNKAPDFQEAQGVLAQMKKEGVRPNEVTFSSLLNKAPDFQEALTIMEEIDLSGVKSYREVSSTLLKISKINIHKTMQSLALIPPQKLFKNYALNKVVRDIFLPNLGETLFFERYFQHLSLQDDNILRFFAEAISTSSLRLQLLECIKIKDWWYLKLKADALLLTDWEETHRLIDEAFQIVEEKNKPNLYAVWAKSVVLNDLITYFPKAIEYCHQALKLQKRNELPYTGKLLIWLIFRQNEDIEVGWEQLKKFIITYDFPKKLVIQFLNKELWEQFPKDGILHYEEKAKLVEDRFW